MLNLVSVFCCLLSIASAQLTWSEIEAGNDDVPAARAGTHMAYDKFGDCLYLFSGSDDRQMWKFDVASSNWVVVHDGNDTNAPVPQARKFAFYGIVRFGGEFGQSLFIISHGFFGGDEFDDTWVFNTEANTWSELNATGPNPSTRYGGHYGVFTNNSGEFWMGGGFTFTTSLPTRYIDTYILRFSSNTEATWIRIHDQPSIGNQFDPLVPHGRCLHASAVVEEEKMVIWGGCMRYVNNTDILLYWPLATPA